MRKLKSIVLYCFLLTFASIIFSCFGECPPGAKKADPDYEGFSFAERKLFPYNQIDSLKLTIKLDSNILVFWLGKTQIDTFYDCDRNGEPCLNCMSQKIKYVNHHFRDSLEQCHLKITHSSGTERELWRYELLSGVYIWMSAKIVGVGCVVLRENLNNQIKIGLQDTSRLRAWFSEGEVTSVVYSRTNGFVKGGFNNGDTSSGWTLKVLK